MDYAILCAVALTASALTLFSGFGLGTLLLPAFAFFFPIPTAVALTAVIHLANNIFKLGLVGIQADPKLVLRFGLPAVPFAFLGALLLGYMVDLPPLGQYRLGDHVYRVRPVGLVVGTLMMVLAMMETLPRFQRTSIPPRWLPVGGALSGFIGGISGLQGALRSAFLLRFKEALTKESFIATNVVIAVLVDVARLVTYGNTLSWAEASQNISIVAAATLSALMGAYVGARLMKKVTMRTVQSVVAAMLFLLAAGVASGLLGS
ncbi:MAG: sulfite exporter TauE/SafE family protein [Planctomycetes bacterium]|nr:sulfite exporter TauE/SafE family protein [Planctomycetota bacterium]